MKATLQMSTSHVTLTRLRHLCEWCDDQLEEEVLSRPFKNIAWFRLEDQDTRIRLHFAAGYDESGFMSAEAEICLQVDDQANMESIIAMMPGSTVESVWLGGLYYTEYEEILGCTVREFMRVRGFGSSRSTSEVERIVPNPRIDSLKHAEEYKRGVAAR
ncbi:hypothetical protein BC938DRAFT_473405 [Jimgerdemannia flammicorona]|nr:hypothetical protein BC938DRAFT_473405 [Jimgerdemannia flammicorona]